MTVYEYHHHAGYGSDDHMADEIIARAARQLGLSGAGGYIAAAVGLTSHAVPMGRALVSLPAGPGVRRRMEAALRRARREVRRRDCAIRVECVRTRIERERDGARLVTERRRGRDWIPISSDLIDAEAVC